MYEISWAQTLWARHKKIFLRHNRAVNLLANHSNQSLIITSMQTGKRPFKISKLCNFLAICLI